MASHSASIVAAAEGRRGPPNELYLVGSTSNYANEVARADHRKQHYFSVDSAPVMVAGRGRPTFITRDDKAAGVSGAADAIRAAQRAVYEAEAAVESGTHPVHINDLHEVAERTTKALVEREAEVLHYKVLLGETMHENPLEPSRVRVMEMRYHTTDGTLSVFEPPVGNTGLMQGPFAKRHVAMDPSSGRAYSLFDFTIGATITVHAQAFVVVDADVATRRLLASKFGIHLDAPLPDPPMVLATVGLPSTAGHGGPRNTVAFDLKKVEDPVHGFYQRAGDTKKQFLVNGSSALRFEGEWREPGTSFADVRRFAVNYYLADDTIEMLDRTSAYSSGGVFSTFLKRQRLPRMAVEAGKEASAAVPAVGAAIPSAQSVAAASDAARAVYAYSKGTTTRSKFVSPITGRPGFVPPVAGEHESGDGGALVTLNGFTITSSRASFPEFLTAADMVCAGIISVYGRPLLLKSCDAFTVAYCIHQFHFDQRTFFVPEGALATAGVRPSTARVPLPPHVGVTAIGGEEETRVNAKTLIPGYKHERDFARYYQLGGKALRFDAIIDPARVDPEDARRRFTVSFYLEDDTLTISEITGNSVGHGPTSVRWLNRGKYRNALAPPDTAAAAALGLKHVEGIPAAVLAAYDRVYGAARDKIGYTESSGAQGYSGGIYGKAERVGAGATGVESSADIGVRDASLHATLPPARHFSAGDFYEGARIVLAHMPSVAFILTRADGYTSLFLASRAASTSQDAKDVFVPENSVPVPTLPLEAVKEDAPAAADEVGEAALIVAKILAGVLESAKISVRQLDRNSRGFAPREAVQEMLASYGVQPPACDAGVVSRLLDAYMSSEDVAAGLRTVTSSSYAVPAPAARPTGGSPARADVPPAALGITKTIGPSSHKPATTVVGSMEDPLAGPFLRDYAGPDYVGVPMVDYLAMFRAITAAGARQQALQPRMDKLLSQLRNALLSSRAHLRKVFRDLDVAGNGIITMREFRHMLARHNLDVNISDAQLRVLMSRFPPAPSASPDPAISWEGFVQSLLDARTLAPSEVRAFVDFVRGLKDAAADGVGTRRVVPQVHPHSNVVSSWRTQDADPYPFLDVFASGTTPAHAVPLEVSMRRTAAADAARGGSAPVRPPTLPNNSVSSVPVSRPSTSAGVRTPAMDVAAAPPPARVAPASLPIAPASRPSTAPSRSTSFAAEVASSPRGTLTDVLSVLRQTESGQGMLAAARAAFAHRRFELYRALQLYDTTRVKRLSIPAFLGALTSAGMKMNFTQTDAMTRAIASGISAAAGTHVHENDIAVDYSAFFDGLF